MVMFQIHGTGVIEIEQVRFTLSHSETYIQTFNPIGQLFTILNSVDDAWMNALVHVHC